jgi:hypothetical protein
MEGADGASREPMTAGVPCAAPWHAHKPLYWAASIALRSTWSSQLLFVFLIILLLLLSPPAHASCAATEHCVDTHTPTAIHTP